MALTGNFSLRYPTDLSLVDIAQDIQNLAEDVDTQLILKARGPASATDNAIARFDGNTGKLIQSSSILIDDSSRFTSDLTVYKNSPTLTLWSTSSTAKLTLRSDNAAAEILFRGGYLSAYDRWVIGKSNESESSGNVGANFKISAYDNSGILLSTPLTITRSTGKVNLGSVGASAGLELGTSGPRMMSGTGSPESVVTAPVGSIWFQTDSTVGVTHWRKATGTGNTGWVVMSGDTGYRAIAASLENGWAGTYFYIRRMNDIVRCYGYMSGVSATSGVIYTLPTGFKGHQTETALSVLANSSGTTYGVVRVETDADVVRAYGTYTNNNLLFDLTWSTKEAWPTSLPGTAA